MATPEFLQFVSYMAIEEQTRHRDVFNTPPKDPRQLKPISTQLPDALTQYNQDLFQNFTLEPPTKPTTRSTDHADETFGRDEQSTAPISPDNTMYPTTIIPTIDNIEILETSIKQDPHEPNEITSSDAATYNDSTTPTPLIHRGKNIEQMKANYQNESIKPKPRKRKRDPNDKIPHGRPTKDSAMLRDATHVEKTELDLGSDDDSQLAIREVQLLSSNGSIRKKFKLLTRHDKDNQCFHIKHYASLEYIAENKKTAFETIKQQRTKLKNLNYLEQNTLANIKENDTL
ncbi:Hypothetical predicted protein [Paramuricea clavata]|uniref:Uncharacterized protein n=1 Tax=Paramuricea clavata TaxID=317549 RepID=A0A7D9D8M5_PARCT|nr:Hypothetical predicted protein [Paramuricea clavata]